eukprot:2598025-Prymnesium_polylepis.1
MVRLLRASRLLNRWRTLISISSGAQSMGKCLVSVLLWSHWLACVWMLQTTFQDSALDTWLAKPYEFCWADPDVPDGADPWRCVEPWKIYAACMCTHTHASNLLTAC